MEHSYKKYVMKKFTRGKLEGLPEIFMTIFGKMTKVQFMNQL